MTTARHRIGASDFRGPDSVSEGVPRRRCCCWWRLGSGRRARGVDQVGRSIAPELPNRQAPGRQADRPRLRQTLLLQVSRPRAQVRHGQPAPARAGLQRTRVRRIAHDVSGIAEDAEKRLAHSATVTTDSAQATIGARPATPHKCVPAMRFAYELSPLGLSTFWP